jgi:hypothetical protein
VANTLKFMSQRDLGFMDCLALNAAKVICPGAATRFGLSFVVFQFIDPFVAYSKLRLNENKVSDR